MHTQAQHVGKRRQLLRLAVFLLVGTLATTVITPSKTARAEMGPAAASVIVQSADFSDAENFEAIDGVLSPDGSTYYALVANPNTPQSRLLAIDVATKAVTSSLVIHNSSGTDTSARFINIQPNGARVWVSVDEATDGILLISTAAPDSNDDGVADASYLAVSSTNPIARPGPVDFNATGTNAFFVTDRDNRSINRFTGASDLSPAFDGRLYSNVVELWQSVAAVGDRVYAIKPDRIVLWGSSLSYRNSSALTHAETTPDDSELWISRTSASRILRISLTGNADLTKEAATSLAVNAPREIAFAQDNPVGVVVGDGDTNSISRFSLFDTADGERVDHIDVDTAQSDPVGLSVSRDGSTAYSIYRDGNQSQIMLLTVETNFSNRTVPENAPTIGFAGTVADGAVCSGTTLNVKEGAVAGDGNFLLTVETDGSTTSAVRIIDMTNLATRDSCLAATPVNSPIVFYAAVDPSGEFLWTLDSRSGSAGVIVWDIEQLASPNSGAPEDATYYGGETPRGLAFRPDTGAGPIEAFITVRQAQNQVRRVTFAGTLTQSFTVPLNSSPDKVATSPAHVFASVDNNVQAIPYDVFGGNGSLGTYSMTAPATSLTVSPDGSELWATVGSENRIVVLNTSDLSLKSEITSFMTNPQAVAFHPTDGTAIVADANGIEVFDAASKAHLSGYNIKSEQSLAADINTRSVVVSGSGDRVAVVDINDATYVLTYQSAVTTTTSAQVSSNDSSSASSSESEAVAPTPAPLPAQRQTLNQAQASDPVSPDNTGSEDSADRPVDGSEHSGGDDGDFSGIGEPQQVLAHDVDPIVPPWVIATAIGVLFLLGAGGSALWWRGRRV